MQEAASHRRRNRRRMSHARGRPPLSQVDKRCPTLLTPRRATSPNVVYPWPFAILLPGEKRPPVAELSEGTSVRIRGGVRKVRSAQTRVTLGTVPRRGA